MDYLIELLLPLVSVDSIWSIVLRAFIWITFVTIFAYGVSKGKNYSKIKTEAGFFVAFILLTGLTIYFVFTQVSN